MRLNLTAKWVLSAATLFLAAPIQSYTATATFYVAPNGSDSNPGTELQPLKSFYRAVQIARPGNTFVFENGLYVETRYPWIETTNGTATAAAPIIFKSRNKHGAVLSFQSGPHEKILIRQHYVTIQDFEITQNVKGGNDHLTYAYIGSSHVSIIGNKMHNAGTDCVKGFQTQYLVVRGNLCYDTSSEGIDVLNSYDVTIADNEVWDVANNGILMKGGIRDAKIFNNYVHGTIGAHAIAIGGHSCTTCSLDPVAGYEAYNSVVYNNIVLSDPPGQITWGLAMIGARDTSITNNVVVGTDYGLFVVSPNNTSVGWGWNPLNKNAVIENNIFQGCTVGSASIGGLEGTFTHDYNTYFNCASPPSQAHGSTADPLFVDARRDWKLRQGSPSATTGVPIAPRQGFLGVPIDVSQDRDGFPRNAPWDRGAYVRPEVNTGGVPGAPRNLRVIPG